MTHMAYFPSLAILLDVLDELAVTLKKIKMSDGRRKL